MSQKALEECPKCGQATDFYDFSYESYFPPPWNINENPEKTEGWIEFQKAMRKDPKYYLGQLRI